MPHAGPPRSLAERPSQRVIGRLRHWVGLRCEPAEDWLRSNLTHYPSPDPVLNAPRRPKTILDRRPVERWLDSEPGSDPTHAKLARFLILTHGAGDQPPTERTGALRVGAPIGAHLDWADLDFRIGTRQPSGPGNPGARTSPRSWKSPTRSWRGPAARPETKTARGEKPSARGRQGGPAA